MALKIRTPLTDLLGIDHPIMLAGMGNVSGSGLAAAVANAGGFGCIGGVFMAPDVMREDIDELVSQLKKKDAPYGVDLLLPKVGGGARKTNKDYTKGVLMELADVMIEKKVKVFVSAVGTAPRNFVDKIHSAGILYMNMVGHVKHVKKALAAGADMICAQGGEGGGHTGDTPFSVLIPSVVDACKGKISPVTGKPVVVVAAGGIFDGRGLAMALAAGASGVWVGTRFVACSDSSASPYHQKLICKAGYNDTRRTIIYTGRPMRVYRTPFVDSWEENRQVEIKKYTSKGIIPVPYGMEGEGVDPLPEDASQMDWIARRPWLMGACSGAIDKVLTAQEIVDQMVTQAVEQLSSTSAMLVTSSKL